VAACDFVLWIRRRKGEHASANEAGGPGSWKDFFSDFFMKASFIVHFIGIRIA
jgi:hypothetical protein